MATSGGRVNRGPAAASDNRRAILRAARRVMAERGYRVPLSTIAREAGVGQGVLYRHFPTRLDLAFAVFEENVTELEVIAADPDPAAIGRLWRCLVDQAISSTAFVEMVVDARRTLPARDFADRLLGLVEATLNPARRAGVVPQEVVADDVLLALRMTLGVVVTAAAPEAVRPAVDRALALLDPPWARPGTGLSR
ncbi:helix-turn-helix domain-containing protein [Blastococcus sp. BMG 814]|uniref:Helix-turn-helix domain-containing protein n=1 Tax=Blastococcus carthaginiensis TaxID=3050034 RepID=A0ABT9I8V5_9ACTN|nr:helix-turn-helix domain-containing protein [Blastococcus carthaginiensis]MDP5181647.1 helix-turn-helix domain-containing protein [Blastococcus carthaginiensis]